MSEGKLKKLLVDARYGDNNLSFGAEVDKILDEAKKHFPLSGTGSAKNNWVEQYFGKFSEEQLRIAWEEYRKRFKESGFTSFESWKAFYGY